MKIYHATLESVTPYSQGRHHDTPKLEREGPEAYDKRTYLQRLHTSMGEIYIPPMAFKLCLEETAQYLGMQVAGRGKATYTKHFRQGILINEPVMLGLKPADTRLERIFTSLEPNKIKGPRGWRHFPVIDRWGGVLQITVVDEIITASILQQHLRLAGQITGIGIWRPANKGMWGKFKLLKLEEVAIDLEEDAAA
jgi:hypothetical protein